MTRPILRAFRRAGVPSAIRAFRGAGVSPALLVVLAGCPSQAPVQTPAEPTPEATAQLGPMPELGPDDDWVPPTPRQVRPAGASWGLLVVPQRDLPLVSVRLAIPTGSVDDPDGGWGAAILAGEMMEQSAGELDALERAGALALLAADFDVSVGRDTTVVSLDVHADRLAEALPLMADAVDAAAFTEEDFARVKTLHHGDLQQQLDDPRYIASSAAPRVLYGDAHPYGSIHQGTLETVASLDRETVKAWYDTHVRPAGAWFVVTGDVEAAAVEAQLAEAFAGWEGGSAEPTAGSAEPRPGLFLVDQPGASQTTIHFLQPGPAGSSEDLVALELARIVVGGTFTSRLNRRLREEKGYTYGAGTYATALRGGGTVGSMSSVRADATAAALKEFRDVLGTTAASGFTEADLAQARAQLRTSVVEAVEMRSSLASAVAGSVASERPPDDLALQLEQAAALDTSALGAAAKAWLDPEEATVLLVGDASVVLPLLEAEGFPEPVRLDPFGAPIEGP